MSRSDEASKTAPGALEQTLMTRVADLPTGVGESRPYLRIIHPASFDHTYPLDGDGVVIGRGVDVDVQLDDVVVSRHHCRVSAGSTGIIVEDMDSTNGTFISGRRVSTASLPPESRLRVGPYVLKVEYKGHSEINAESRLREAARHDPLTGIPNRGYFFSQAADLLGELSGPEHWISAVMVDIDHFKQINDSCGHAVGDQVIRAVANILRNGLRERDLLGRYGGEEFVMVLPHADMEHALSSCERVREMIAREPIDCGTRNVPVTVSMGVCATRRGELTSVEALLSTADAAMYRAKKRGRNRVCAQD